MHWDATRPSAAYWNLLCDGVWLVRIKIVTTAALERHSDIIQVMLAAKVALFSLSSVDRDSLRRCSVGWPRPAPDEA